ncbi:MAG TPA: response regulator [Tepidisphaeraceae bacterium]|nr:response regulator [Tepidisphaeraceae bacterium]
MTIALQQKKVKFPTVMLIDDDRQTTKYWRELVHSGTSMGVITANSVGQGKRLLTEGGIQVNAIIADLYLEGESEDGLDFLKYAQETFPDVPRYVLSWWADRNIEKEKAKGMNLDVRRWIPKTVVGKGEESPCVVIERELVEESLQGHPEIRDVYRQLHQDDPGRKQNILDLARTFGAITQTYLQELPDDSGLALVKPIEVICTWEDEDEIRTTARDLGLLCDGRGKTIEQSIEHLAESIVFEKDRLDSTGQSHVVGWAKEVNDKLNEYIVRSKTEAK